MSLTYSIRVGSMRSRCTTWPRPCESLVDERSSTGVSNSSDRAKASATKS